MNKLMTIIAIFLMALVVIAGCGGTSDSGGGEGTGSQDLGPTENSDLDEDVDPSELDGLDVDDSLF